MEAQEPSEKQAKRRRANWGDGGIAFFALRAEIAGELDRKVPHVPYLRQASAQVGD